MDVPERIQRSGRETRLLLVTIAVSVGVLFLLARFRFPEQAAEPPATAAAAPLERLAARAAYDELASTMTDLERRLTGRVIVLPIQPQRETGGYVVAPRVMPDRAATLLYEGEALPGDGAGTSRILSRDVVRQIAVVSVPGDTDGVVVPRSGVPRPGPRYVVAVEGSADGLTLRPVYVGRSALLQDARTATPLLSLSGIQQPIPRGAALFSLEGTFLGLVLDSGRTTTVVPGDFLRTAAETAAAAANRAAGYIGVDVEMLTEALARASGAQRGVVVNDVYALGPAANVLQPGDVIDSINDRAVTSVAGFREAEQSMAPGQPATMSIVRRRVPERVTIKAADAREPLRPQAPDGPGFVGRAVPGTGIEVVAVNRSTPAARAGLLRGDLIVALDGRTASDPAELARTYRSASPGTAWLVTVQRGQQHRVLALEKH